MSYVRSMHSWRCDDTDEVDWIKCDDESISHANTREVLGAEAYMYFFLRK